MSIAKRIYRTALKVFSPLFDWVAAGNFKGLARRRGGAAPFPRLRVAFVVFEPETWDKQEPVYSEFLKRPAVDVDVVVVPNFNRDFSSRSGYGEEVSFFERECGSVVLALDEETGHLRDFRSNPYDYLFYQDSYNRHYPRGLRPYEMSRYSKICYIPYGFSGSAVFDSIADNREFYRHVSFAFADSSQKRDSLEQSFFGSRMEGFQHFEYCGYPILEKYLSLRDIVVSGGLRVTWTPRWSYDEKIGGSHFLEFKEDFLQLADDLDADFTFRPHPMMFEEFLKKGLLSQEESDAFVLALKDKSVAFSANEPITELLVDTDILITDYSSIIIMFFLTGRPIIYCDSSISFNDSFEVMREGMYIAHSWEDVSFFVREISAGRDPLKTMRKTIIEESFNAIHGSAKRIVEIIEGDYWGRS